jgi:hypothetical protein
VRSTNDSSASTYVSPCVFHSEWLAAGLAELEPARVDWPGVPRRCDVVVNKPLRLPWGITNIIVPPSGLRDCVLRIEYIGHADVTEIAGRQGTTMLQTVARWRLCDPERWAELVKVMGIHVTPANRKEG